MNRSEDAKEIIILLSNIDFQVFHPFGTPIFCPLQAYTSDPP